MHNSEELFQEDKEAIKNENQKEYLRLVGDVREMMDELQTGKLSPSARADLEKKISEHEQAIEILDNSVRALLNKDALMIADEDQDIEVEIKDSYAFFKREHEERLQEIEALKKEKELMRTLLPEEKLPEAIKEIEARIEEARNSANEIYRKIFSNK